MTKFVIFLSLQLFCVLNLAECGHVQPPNQRGLQDFRKAGELNLPTAIPDRNKRDIYWDGVNLGFNFKVGEVTLVQKMNKVISGQVAPNVEQLARLQQLLTGLLKKYPTLNCTRTNISAIDKYVQEIKKQIDLLNKPVYKAPEYLKSLVNDLENAFFKSKFYPGTLLRELNGIAKKAVDEIPKDLKKLADERDKILNKVMDQHQVNKYNRNLTDAIRQIAKKPLDEVPKYLKDIIDALYHIEDINVEEYHDPLLDYMLWFSSSPTRVCESVLRRLLWPNSAEINLSTVSLELAGGLVNCLLTKFPKLNCSSIKISETFKGLMNEFDNALKKDAPEVIHYIGYLSERLDQIARKSGDALIKDLKEFVDENEEILNLGGEQVEVNKFKRDLDDALMKVAKVPVDEVPKYLKGFMDILQQMMERT